MQSTSVMSQASAWVQVCDGHLAVVVHRTLFCVACVAPRPAAHVPILAFRRARGLVPRTGACAALSARSIIQSGTSPELLHDLVVAPHRVAMEVPDPLLVPGALVSGLTPAYPTVVARRRAGVRVPVL